MSVIRLNIDGREVRGHDGQTILEIARENGIQIPTLCHDDRVQMYGACGVCVVEAENSPKLLRSCSTYAADGMILRTDTDRVVASRKTALELLLSDHTGDCRPPCVLACPAQTDCQGYVGLIANGQYKEALKLVKDKIPLPASIGRVCPHPCEDACRRQLVEEPISIASLKQFVGDLDLASGRLYAAEVGEATGKKVAVIGGGPGGLTAAYFLRVQGHAVTVFDAMPHMGGMLRYGIPEYRLPKKLLQAECDAIESMGVTYQNNIKIGKDLTLDYLRETYDAVIVAVGAWSSTGLRCPGEELDGVVGGIDFLREVAMGAPVFTGRRVAVVGGGNTAMDACRTAVRLGADKVYNVYRRTRNEMPAEEIEIIEAEEEGVVFKNLTNPIEVVGENGKVSSVRLQVMELGEPDASGRRAPVPVEGKEETLPVDTVVVAIGQKLNAAGLEAIEQTGWRTIAADESTFRTNLTGVFAIGDATNNGADIAITAIGEAKKCAGMVDRFLGGEELAYETPYVVTSEKTGADFAHEKKQPRAKMPHRRPAERRTDFLEINLGLGEEEAKREAGRCLECGCMDYFECKLIDYANRYKVQPEKYAGAVHHNATMDDHPFLRRNPDKCILCGLCVRICDEVVGATALGLVDRGFDTVVKPALDLDLRDTDCIACGQCVSACPTGALTEVLALPKQVPLREKATGTTCAFCSVGCGQKLAVSGGMLSRSLPAAERDADALLCIKGRFGFGRIDAGERLTMPLIRRDVDHVAAGYQQAAVFANKHLQALQTQYGKDCVAVAVSDRYTNEEVKAIQAYAGNILSADRIYSFGRTGSGLADVLGRDASTATFDELESTGLIVLVGTSLMQNHGVAGMKVRRAVRGGAGLLVIGGSDPLLEEIATLSVDAGEDLSVLSQIAKALMNGQNLPGYAGLEQPLSKLAVGGQAAQAAKLIADAKKAVFVFEKNTITGHAARLVGDLAVLSGHADGPRNGVLQLLPGPNSQGLSDAGVLEGEILRAKIASGEVRGLFVFGEDIPDLGQLDFLAVQDLHMTGTAAKADVVFPAASYAEVEGTFTSADGKVRSLSKAVDGPVPCVREQIKILTDQAGKAKLLPVQAPAQADRAVKLVPPAGTQLYREARVDTNALAADLTAYARSCGVG